MPSETNEVHVVRGVPQQVPVHTQVVLSGSSKGMMQLVGRWVKLCGTAGTSSLSYVHVAHSAEMWLGDVSDEVQAFMQEVI